MEFLRKHVAILSIAAIGFTTGAANGQEPSCVTAPAGLVSWWPGDNNTDDISDGNTGLLIGDTTFTVGRVGDAFALPGSGIVESRVEVPESSNLRIITGGLTLDAWINFVGIDPQTPGISNSPIVAKWGDTALGTAGYGLAVRSTGTVVFAVSTTGRNIISVSSDAAIPQGTYTHVAGVWTGSQLELYVDGVRQISTPPFAGPIYDNVGVPVVIGGYSSDHTTSNDSLIGQIDEIEIFDRALSQEEIQAIFNAGGAGKCKTIEVGIDIKPGSFPNSINLSSGGATPVAILGSTDLDVNEINVTTLSLGTAGIKTVGKLDKYLCSVEDVSGDFSFGPEGASDGFDDLVCHFVTIMIVPEEGDTVATLSGELLDGTPIEGSDSVNIVP